MLCSQTPIIIKGLRGAAGSTDQTVPSAISVWDDPHGIPCHSVAIPGAPWEMFPK
jgi:hypothetical protein